MNFPAFLVMSKNRLLVSNEIYENLRRGNTSIFEYSMDKPPKVYELISISPYNQYVEEKGFTYVDGIVKSVIPVAPLVKGIKRWKISINLQLILF